MTAPRPTTARTVPPSICPAQESRACIAAQQFGQGAVDASVREGTR